MKRHYQVLNGDCLKEQLPGEIEGEIIVARECLVDGEVKSDNLEELFQLRADFISKLSDNCSKEDYRRDTVSEFEKIKGIPPGSTVNLWFEDDLFCQVNFWFVTYLLSHFVQDCNVFLVRPEVHTRFGFGGLNSFQLMRCYEQKVPISQTEQIAALWESYRNGDIEHLQVIALELKDEFPFIPEAVEAHIERIPTENSLGRPTESLLEIMEDLETEEFGVVFREFSKRESIYGFGDLQVKRLMDNIKDRP